MGPVFLSVLELDIIVARMDIVKDAHAVNATVGPCIKATIWICLGFSFYIKEIKNILREFFEDRERGFDANNG